MSGTEASSAPIKNAKQSRRTGLSSRTADRKRRLSWTRPFCRTRKALGRSLRLLESSCRVIEAAERFAARRPLRAAHEYERVSVWLNEATAQLSNAARALSVTLGKVALSPAQAWDAPPLIIGETERWIGAAGKLAALSNRLDETLELILDSIASGTPLDFTAILRNQSITPPRVIRLRPLPPRRLSAGSGGIRVIHSRRRRSVRVAVAEAVRRIVRGRAPPLVSTCCCSF